MPNKDEHLNKKQKVGITIGTTVGGILIIAAIVLALLFGCKPKSKTTPTYTVTWENYNGDVLEKDTNVEEGTMPSYDSATPTKPSTEDYNYAFTGWTPELKPVTRNITYTALFSENIKTYTVTWCNYDGSVLETDYDVPRGTIPSYNGATPEKPMDENYTYEFRKWDPDIMPVTDDITYTALFAASVRTFTVSFAGNEDYVSYDVASVEDVPYGTDVIINDNTVYVNGTLVTAIVNGGDEYDTYVGAGWNFVSDFTVTSDVTLTYNVTKTATLYDITFVTTLGGIMSETETRTQMLPYNWSPFGGTSGEHVKTTSLVLNGEYEGSSYTCQKDLTTPVEDFYDIVFDGWYVNNSPLRYGQELTGSQTIEARFTRTLKDHSYLFDYSFDADAGTVAITGLKSEYNYTSDYKALVIPETRDGYPITVIKGATLGHFEGLETVYIPKTLESFEEGSWYPFCQDITLFFIDQDNTHFTFEDGVLYNYSKTELIRATNSCIHLVDDVFVVPSTVTHIWQSAFMYNSSITHISLPSSITTIPKWCFAYSSIQELVVPEGVTTLENSAIYYCRDLTNVQLPSTLETIDSLALGYNFNLAEVNIPASVTSLSYQAFNRSTSLTAINVDSANANYSSIDGVLYNKEKTELLACPEGLETAPEFPTTLTTIGCQAFDGSRLTSIALPEGVTTIKEYGLSFIAATYISLPSTIQTIEYQAFYDCQATALHYAGTVEQWNALNLPGSWRDGASFTEIICSDGTITL